MTLSRIEAGAKVARGVKETGRTLSNSEFNILMQTIALAAWQGGDTRVATEQAFGNAVKIAQAEAAWESSKNDNGPDVTNLAMNFYLKAAEAGQRGFAEPINLLEITLQPERYSI